MRHFHPQSGYWFDPRDGGFYSQEFGGRHHGHHSSFNFFMDDFLFNIGGGYQEEVIIQGDGYGGYYEEVVVVDDFGW